MEGNIIGINENGLSISIDKIQDRLLKITEELNSLKDMVDSTNFYIGDDIGISLRNKFNDFANYFPTIIENINIILNELNSCRSNYQRHDVKTSVYFNNYIDE